MTHLLSLKNLAAAAMLFAGSCLLGSQAFAATTASAARRDMLQIYAQLHEEFGQTTTLYCGCPIYYRGSGFSLKWTIDITDCGYKIKKNAKRAKRIELDRIMSGKEFGHSMPCWQDGGRKKCDKDSKFLRMDNDLHNIYPSIGEINNNRSYFPLVDWRAAPGMYGRCEMVVDFKKKLAQPPQAARGMIARAYLYMVQKYHVDLDSSQMQLYKSWDSMYPPSEFECRRNELIKQKQGNDNPFITRKCAAY